MTGRRERSGALAERTGVLVVACGLDLNLTYAHAYDTR
jgi:hypothetical protein